MSARHFAAQIAANERWARTEDRNAATAPARAGFMKKFELLVDPDGSLEENERSRRAGNALRAHMARLRAESAKKRAGANAAGDGSAK